MWEPRAVRKQFVDAAVQMGGQPSDYVAEGSPRSCPLSLADCTRLITTLARLPATSLQANSHALRPIAHGITRLSWWLLSTGTHF